MNLDPIQLVIIAIALIALVLGVISIYQIFGLPTYLLSVLSGQAVYNYMDNQFQHGRKAPTTNQLPISPELVVTSARGPDKLV